MNILLVDDERFCREPWVRYLENEGHSVQEAINAEAALALCHTISFDLILCDFRLPGMDGLEFLHRFKAESGAGYCAVVIVTGHGDVLSTVEAIQTGAFAYLVKPLSVDDLAVLVMKVEEYLALKRENQLLTQHFQEAVDNTSKQFRDELVRIQTNYSFSLGIESFLVNSTTMSEVVRQASILGSNHDVTLLICGETGVGKDMVVRMIHSLGTDKMRPFVDLNCAALVPKLIESELFGYEGGAYTGSNPGGRMGKLTLAENGILFLDEIGELSDHLQTKLLRVLETREYYRVGGLKKLHCDAQIICATNANLEEMVKEGLFRRDLYFRLKGGCIYIPPLRDRTEEIMPLAEHFLARYNREKCKHFQGFTNDARSTMLNYAWPGNIRELKNAIERAVLLGTGDVIDTPALDLPCSSDFSKSLVNKTAGTKKINYPRFDFPLPEEGFYIDDLVDYTVKRVLEYFKGNKSETARYLHISRNALYRRLQRTSQTDPPE